MGEALPVVLLVIEIVALAVGVGVTIYGYVKADELASQVGEIKNTDVSVTHASEGMPVPVVYGKATLCGNVLWWKYLWEDVPGMAAGPNSEGVRTISIWQSICMGAIYAGNVDVYRNDEHWLQRDGDTTWDAFGTWPQGFDGGYHSIQFCSGAEGGGEPNTPPYKIDGATPIETYATRLRGMSHIFIRGLAVMGDESACPTIRYKVRRSLSTPLTYNEVEVGGTYYGQNPAAVLYDLLTNTQYGLGLAASQIDAANFSTASEYFHEQKLGINFILSPHLQAREVIAKVQSWVDCLLTLSDENTYQIKVMKNDDTPVATMTDDDFLEFTFQRRSWDDTYNDFRADYTPDHGWLQKTLILKNEANISVTGSERQKKIDLTAFCDVAMASKRLHVAMKRESYPYALGQAMTNLKFSHVAAGDVVTVNSAEYGINTQFRVIARDTSEVDQNKVTFQMMQMTEKISDANYEDAADPLGTEEPGQMAAEDDIENLTFPAFTDTSTARSVAFTDPENSRVKWGAGQEQVGFLSYDVAADWSGDYRVVDGDTKIQLNPTTFAADIQANALGLLNVDVWEAS